jgi:hypothetical protein
VSIAWTTVVLVVLLLPGVLFAVGLYLPEQFTRETAPRSPLGQLAGVVFVSLLVHGGYYVIQGYGCGSRMWPCVDLTTVLGLLSAGKPGEVPLSRIERIVFPYRTSIFIYSVASSLAGGFLGWLVGRQVAGGRLRALAQHGWVFDLPMRTKNGHTYAYVLSKLTKDERHVVYSGRLEQFGLQVSGQFAYLVLTNVCRSYLRLGDQNSSVDALEHLIGEHSRTSRLNPEEEIRVSYFVINGADVSNVVFESREMKVKGNEAQELQEVLSVLLTAGSQSALERFMEMPVEDDVHDPNRSLAD